jgi:hypothetical protein
LRTREWTKPQKIDEIQRRAGPEIPGISKRVLLRGCDRLVDSHLRIAAVTIAVIGLRQSGAEDCPSGVPVGEQRLAGGFAPKGRQIVNDRPGACAGFVSGLAIQERPPRHGCQ